MYCMLGAVQLTVRPNVAADHSAASRATVDKIRVHRATRRHTLRLHLAHMCRRDGRARKRSSPRVASICARATIWAMRREDERNHRATRARHARPVVLHDIVSGPLKSPRNRQRGCATHPQSNCFLVGRYNLMKLKPLLSAFSACRR